MVRYFDEASADADRLPRILSRADAIERGFTRDAITHRLRTGRWNLVLPHTYLTSDVLTWTDRQRAALAYAGDEALLSAAAALADTGLATVERPDALLVLVPRRSTATTRQWVRIRRTGRMPVPAAFPGPPRADFARAVADLALERPRLDDVRALVTQAIRAGLCTGEQLSTELVEGPRRHSKNLRLALEDVLAGAWSAPEARAARLLRTAHVPPFEQNARIDLPDGRHVVADFFWRTLRAVLEIDSVQHHFRTPAQRDATDDKHLRLMAAGIAVAHRTPWAINREPARFVRGMERWLAARARELAA
jgi:very-short-patch-repair endonuclease